MKLSKTHIPDKNTLCSEFLQRHSILPTPIVQRELSVIYWVVRTKLEVDHDLVNRVDTLNQADPVWALLRSMLDRIFEYIEGAICAYVTGSTAASEIISRTTIESAVNLLFILVDSRDGSHLTQYLSHYFSNEEKEIDRWLNLVDSLDSDAKRVHQLKAIQKKTTLISLKKYIDQALAEFKLPTTEQAVKKWPNIAERFKLLGLELDYRTVYAALCSQTHNDAEDLLNYFVVVSLGNRDLLDKVGLETVNFSRLMMYMGVEYYISAAGGYAVRFELNDALDGISQGRNIILKELEKIANELDSAT
ncbi:MAG: hypothetical protein KME15_22815 [Drouetiella hepatica Uher 2000/2452]|jgi:hypothetical protein|uniref:Uncharacterized protein n=1 Tax=Drouetiella hepatica Uher 2000/2452 TaxID=904376 RepID=A0A951QFE1_9CYAN|nr:hypothetical protein [Drouetiella hepatica Uher 2000/2452]